MNLNNQITGRRVLALIVVIGLAGAGIGVGTLAFFTDEATSEDNQITAGTLELDDASNVVINVTNAKPGDRIPTNNNNSITVDYDGSIEPVNVDFNVSLSEPATEPSGDTPDVNATQFASQLDVETANLTVNGENVNNLTSTKSVSTLADLHAINITSAYGGVSQGDTVGVDLALTFNKSAGNQYQADGVNATVSFEATQQGA